MKSRANVILNWMVMAYKLKLYDETGDAKHFGFSRSWSVSSSLHVRFITLIFERELYWMLNIFLQRSQHAFISTELSQQPLKFRRKKESNSFDSMNTHYRIYEIFDKYCQIVNLQQLNTAHAQWCITLHTRNTTKFANLEVTIDAICGLNSRWLSTKTTSTWYLFHRKLWVCIDIIDLTVTHQTNILTKSLPLRHRLLITDRIHFNIVIVVVVSFLNRFWVSILEKHSDCFVYRAFMRKL